MFPEKVMLEQRPEGAEGVSHACLGELCRWNSSCTLAKSMKLLQASSDLRKGEWQVLLQRQKQEEKEEMNQRG
jgi:hypothetical protein